MNDVWGSNNTITCPSKSRTQSRVQGRGRKKCIVILGRSFIFHQVYRRCRSLITIGLKSMDRWPDSPTIIAFRLLSKLSIGFHRIIIKYYQIIILNKQFSIGTWSIAILERSFDHLQFCQWFSKRRVHITYSFIRSAHIGTMIITSRPISTIRFATWGRCI